MSPADRELLSRCKALAPDLVYSESDGDPGQRLLSVTCTVKGKPHELSVQCARQFVARARTHLLRQCAHDLAGLVR